MNQTPTIQGEAPAGDAAARKPYHAPKVQEYGKVHLLTQGSGGAAADGGGAMTMM